MNWWAEQLGKDKQGSRPRCVLLTDGYADEVAERLTALVDHPDVVVSPGDNWMPCGKPIRKEDGSWTKLLRMKCNSTKQIVLYAPKFGNSLGNGGLQFKQPGLTGTLPALAPSKQIWGCC